jgi:hypothetical protein
MPRIVGCPPVGVPASQGPSGLSKTSEYVGPTDVYSTFGPSWAGSISGPNPSLSCTVYTVHCPEADRGSPPTPLERGGSGLEHEAAWLELVAGLDEEQPIPEEQLVTL